MKHLNTRQILAVSAGAACVACAFAAPSILRSQYDVWAREVSADIDRTAIQKMFPTKAQMQLVADSESDSTLNEASLYGYVGAGSFGKKMGLYKVFQDGGNEYMWAEGLQSKNFNMLSGWMRDGHICGFAQFGFGSFILGYAYEELDLTTGADVTAPYIIDLSDNYLPYYQIATYNPNDDKVYGYGYVQKYGDQSVFKSSPAANPADAQIVNDKIAASDVCLALCYNDDENVMAGINLNHEFVYIDNTGKQTVVMDMGIEGLQNIASAMVWSPADGYYIFNAILANKVSELYAIDPVEKSVTQLSPVSDSLTFIYLLSTGNAGGADAPRVPEITSVDFGAGLSDGTMTFFMPSEDGNGTSLGSENMSYTVWLDGNVYKEASAAAGSEVKTNFSNLAAGMHVFRVMAKGKNHNSPKATARAFIGNDTPLAPENVSLTTKKVSWDAVTKGVNGGYLDLSDIEYDVYLNDEYIESTSETEMEIELPEGELTAYSCKVYATCRGKESTYAESNSIVFGDPWSLNVNIEPTNEQAEVITVLDRNDDGDTWIPRKYRGGLVFSCSTNSINTGDDWLFVPGIKFDDKDAVYSLSFEACCNSEMKNKEYLEVWISTTPDLAGERICLLEKTHII